ncbi:MAG: cysteine sulfinate desulfinase [Ignavibacteria bacterium CG2_30_36_16]|nr:cysteine desulfurase [Ignavibacteria bacterium]OIP55942.1 MAG: cysteine sulfinate desulfinase [Ignavibacteria bacterium CG2_30_36_16]PJB00980.1 MAG: cysteine desulfurase CsdA [Ignavibacteria bacterium CG_4_9_14_3_um_filter_36_18]
MPEAGIFNIEKIRNDFPILSKTIHGKPLVYLDNAATTQKPQIVIDSLVEYYTSMNANVHRGVHHLSEVSTKAFEDSRIKIKNFLNANSDKEIIFTRGTTESINLVASSYGRANFKAGDEIVVTAMEHHSNLVPWQLIAKEKNMTIKVIPVDDNGELILNELENIFSEKTKFAAINFVSNSLGTINDVKKIIETAHQYNVPVLLDAAQAINHLPVDVQKLDCEFLAFSGHKLYGPTGIGVLYGKEKLLDAMPPFMGGGDMIARVTYNESTYNELPYKFEAGTSNIADAIGLGVAIDYVEQMGIEKIAMYENSLLEYATAQLQKLDGLKIIGTAKNKCAVISFIFDTIHPHDVGTFLDFEGIAIRTGHHCTQPLMHRFGIPATSRASFAMYNTKDEIDILINGVKKVIEVFK